MPAAKLHGEPQDPPRPAAYLADMRVSFVLKTAFSRILQSRVLYMPSDDRQEEATLAGAGDMFGSLLIWDAMK